MVTANYLIAQSLLVEQQEQMVNIKEQLELELLGHLSQHLEQDKHLQRLLVKQHLVLIIMLNFIDVFVNGIKLTEVNLLQQMEHLLY